MIKYLFLLCLLTINCNANDLFFSAKLINDNFITVAIKGDEVLMRALITGQSTQSVEQRADGKFYIVGNGGQQIQPKDVNKIQSKYMYYIPHDGCYKLTNLYKVCTNKGKIITLIKYQDGIVTQQDPFFTESSDECNIFKFDIAKKIFALNEKVDYKEFQLVTEGYPDFIKVVIVDYKQIITKMPKADLSRSTNLRAFYVSSENDVGCVPYQNLRLYDAGEAQMYKMYTPPYKLLGKNFTDEKRMKNPFLLLDKSRVIRFRKDFFDNLDN